MDYPKRSELDGFDINRDITVSRDGNEWFALFGINLELGVAGYGETVMKAIEALNKQPEFTGLSAAKIFRVSENDGDFYENEKN